MATESELRSRKKSEQEFRAEFAGKQNHAGEDLKTLLRFFSKLGCFAIAHFFYITVKWCSLLIFRPTSGGLLSLYNHGIES